MSPLVSVVIPTYNRAATIGRALASVRAQSCQDFEVIVVDDCSPSEDDTAGIIARLGDERITFLRLDRNRGGGGARNAGIERARGRYVAFLDSDDEWAPHKLARQLAAYEQNETPERTVVYSQVLLKGIDYAWINPERGLREGEDVSEYLFANEYHMQTSTLMVPRSVAAEVGFAEIPRHQDYDFCLRLQHAGVGFAFVAEPLTVFHQSADLSRTSSMTAFEYSRTWLRERAPLMNDAGRRGFAVHVVYQMMMLSRRPLQALVFAARAGALGAALVKFPVYFGRAFAPDFVVRWHRRRRSQHPPQLVDSPAN